jgi:nicotinamidase/pyrazinamidase
MRKIVFLDIDTQHDFMDKGGKLYVPGAEKIVPNLGRLTRFAENKGILIISSLDTHRRDDPEFKQFPPHCVRGTKGQRKIAHTNLPDVSIIRNRRYSRFTLDKLLETKKQILIEKRTFDVFSNSNLRGILRNFDTAIVYGVATDYCVKEACLGSLRAGLDTYLVVDAIKAVSEAGQAETLKILRERGARFIKTRELIEKLK